MKTKVKFLIEKMGNGVFAYFPEMVHSYNGYRQDNMTCYSHIGQHSACHVDYANECKEADYNEYLPLLRELISIGYKLEILNSQEIEAHRKPTAGEVKFGEGAIHYRTLPLSDFIKPDGNLKDRIKANDNLTYSRL